MISKSLCQIGRPICLLGYSYKQLHRVGILRIYTTYMYDAYAYKRYSLWFIVWNEINTNIVIMLINDYSEGKSVDGKNDVL